MVKTNESKQKGLKPKQTRTSRIPKFKSDSKEIASLIKAGRHGAALAIRESKALGLTITYLEKGILYKEHSDGTKEIIENAEVNKEDVQNSGEKTKLKYRKGMILHAKN